MCSLYVLRADLIAFLVQVIGAGVVGLAVARRLASREGTSTILLERHEGPGTETSSRNSEVRQLGARTKSVLIIIRV